MEFLPTKTIKSLSFGGSNGSFSIDKARLEFHTCRERFAEVFNSKTEGIYFAHEKGNGENVAQFIKKTEEILQINPQRRSRFALTNRETILWVGPSKFWTECPMKRSLFTILLRAGLSYKIKTDNYEEALLKQSYASYTLPAVQRFMFGFTRFAAKATKHDGWYTTFYLTDQKAVRRLLVKPTQTTKKSEVHTIVKGSDKDDPLPLFI